jgi:hypothetical protein
MIYCLYEHVDRTRVEQLIKNNAIDDDVRKQLKSYLRKYDNGNKAFKVEYEQQGLMIGRKYAKGSLSLQNFKKSIRETLVHDTHTDIDIVNCHIVLLSQYCDKNGLKCACLDDYVDNRNVRLQDIIHSFKTSRKIAKELILVMMYGGNVNDYCCKNGFDVTVPMPEWVGKLEQELILLTDRISAIESTIMADVKRLKKKEYQNKKASCLSYVLQVIEDDLIMSCATKLKQLGYEVDTLCFDGLLVNKNDVSTDVLEELSAYCFETTGYKVEFSFKPMDKHYECVPEEYDFSDYDFKCLDEYSQTYCASLVGETSEETYQLRKTYLEHFICKVQQPQTVYLYQNGKHKLPQIMNPTELKELFKPIQSGYVSQQGVPQSFTDRWTNDVKHRLYRTMDFIPFNQESPIEDDNVFNLFEGFNPDIYGEEMNQDTIQKKITPYLDLVKELCGGEEDHAMYFHRFIAQIFQDPNRKVPICVIFKGKQGTGKNMMLDAIGNMLNKTHYITSSKPTDFFGDHAEGFCKKLLVNLNECEGKDTFDFEGKIKSFITEDTITVNPKNVRPYSIANMARTVITTQKPNPVPIDVKTKDRRYVVYKTTDKYLKMSSKFWTQLYNHLRKSETMQALYQWFMKFDLTDFDWIKRRPLTEAYKEMCNLYSPIEALFFEEFYDNETWVGLEYKGGKNDIISISMQDLFEAYEGFCRRHRFLKDDTKATSSRAFISKLVDLEIPMTRLKTDGVRCVRISPKEVYDYIDRKQWINGFDHEKAELEYADTGDDGEEGYFS